MKNSRIPVLLMALALASPVLAQMRNYSTKDKKAIKLYEDGLQCMHERDMGCAEKNLVKAANFDEHFVEPRFALAELYDLQGRDTDAMQWYRDALALSPRYFPNAYLHLADIEFRNQEYSAAEQHYKDYIGLNEDPVRKARARLGVENCVFAARAIHQPVPFDPVNLGPQVNSADPEYYPCLTADDSTLIFTRRVAAPHIRVYGAQEDFYVSRRGMTGEWGPSSALPVVNTPDHNEGAGTLTPDGRFIIFTKCALADGTYGEGLSGFGSCDLFISRRIGDRWTRPENLGPPVNSRNWETQPSMASDGRTLYFVRGLQARDGIKSMDIWMTRLQDDGSFSVPEKLPEQVNTPFEEESVQIHPDGRTLYFSSNGHPGFGGLDIFMSRKDSTGQWGPALNLGWPINSGADENSLLVSSNGRLAYFASDRKGGHGSLDLYSFELYKEARPHPVTYIRGRVTDRATGKPLEADVLLYDVSDGTLATAAYSDPSTGEFLVCLPTDRTYALNAQAEGYLFFSRNYAVQGDATAADPVALDVPMSPLTSGATIALRNVFFNSASAQLLPESHVELDKLADLLVKNPTLRIELGGHTDNVGADDANLRLSDERAKAVRDHLVRKGIAADRIEARGYGETMPTESNTTEEGRALNRRTEVKVL